MNITPSTIRATAEDLTALFITASTAHAALNAYAEEFTGYAIREIFSANMGGTNDRAVNAVLTELHTMI